MGEQYVQGSIAWHGCKICGDIMVLLGSKNLRVTHHKRPGLSKLRIYLEKTVNQGGDRVQAPNGVPEAVATAIFKWENHKETAAESHSTIM